MEGSLGYYREWASLPFEYLLSVSDDHLSLISSGGASYLQFMHLPLLINSTIVLLFLFDRSSIFKKNEKFRWQKIMNQDREF